jgi:hypothetical protein
MPAKPGGAQVAAATGVAKDGGSLSIDGPSSIGRRQIQRCPRGCGGMGVQVEDLLVAAAILGAAAA